MFIRDLCNSIYHANHLPYKSELFSLLLEFQSKSEFSCFYANNFPQKAEKWKRKS